MLFLYEMCAFQFIRICSVYAISTARKVVELKTLYKKTDKKHLHLIEKKNDLRLATKNMTFYSVNIIF